MGKGMSKSAGNSTMDMAAIGGLSYEIHLIKYTPVWGRFRLPVSNRSVRGGFENVTSSEWSNFYVLPCFGVWKIVPIAPYTLANIELYE